MTKNNNYLDDVKVKKLLSKGKKQGYFTYDELNSVLDQKKFSAEIIEELQLRIVDLGITVVAADDDYDYDDYDYEASIIPRLSDKTDFLIVMYISNLFT